MDRHGFGNRRAAGQAAAPVSPARSSGAEAGKAVNAQPGIQAVLSAGVQAFDQQRNDARLLGWEELVPQRVDLLPVGAGIGRLMPRTK